jgi:histo-blood group ABO system transferase
MDIDMIVEKPIEQASICGNGITATLHPGFPESFERNPKSTAYLPATVTAPYYQGCFIGGRTDSFLNMSRSIAEAIDKDDKCGIMAIWNDESHANKYLHQNRPAITLSPGYAFPALHYLKHPETWCPEAPEKYQPFIRHLEKVDQGKWKNK